MEKNNKQVSWIITVGIFAIVTGLIISIAIPNFTKARSTASTNHCVNNLRQIYGAKEQWGLDLKKGTNAVPNWRDLVGEGKYLKRFPVCPEGGVYDLRRIADSPLCSLSEGKDSHRHRLPD